MTHTDDLVVVMDHFGGDWTPFAALPTLDEAHELVDHLTQDANATCENAPYYPSIAAVDADAPQTPPADLTDPIVVFDGSTVHGVAQDDSVARALAIKHNGGTRGPTTRYESADAALDDKPSATGQFIATDITADDYLSDLD